MYQIGIHGLKLDVIHVINVFKKRNTLFVRYNDNDYLNLTYVCRFKTNQKADNFRRKILVAKAMCYPYIWKMKIKYL